MSLNGSLTSGSPTSSALEPLDLSTPGTRVSESSAAKLGSTARIDSSEQRHADSAATPATADREIMELRGPEAPAPAVLLLGSSCRQPVADLCVRVGFVVDCASTRDEAFDLFLSRGGHDVVVCTGGGDEHLATMVALERIDPGLASRVLSEAATGDQLPALERWLAAALKGGGPAR